MTGQQQQSAGGVVLDLSHLETQTMGSTDLAREVLRLFLDQASELMARLADPAERRADVAHKLVGSARGIGLPAVAATAAALEQALRDGGAGAAELAPLVDAVRQADAAIRAYLDGEG